MASDCRALGAAARGPRLCRRDEVPPRRVPPVPRLPDVAELPRPVDLARGGVRRRLGGGRGARERRRQRADPPRRGVPAGTHAGARRKRARDRSDGAGDARRPVDRARRGPHGAVRRVSARTLQRLFRALRRRRPEVGAPALPAPRGREARSPTVTTATGRRSRSTSATSTRRTSSRTSRRSSAARPPSTQPPARASAPPPDGADGSSRRRRSSARGSRRTTRPRRAARRLLQEGLRAAEHHLAGVGRRGAVLRLDRRRAPRHRRRAATRSASRRESRAASGARSTSTPRRS